MNYILLDGPNRHRLLPFTYTRPVADIRVGILSIREKWEKYLDEKTYTQTETYLAEKWPLLKNIAEATVFINASFLPTEKLIAALSSLNPGQVLYFKEKILAYKTESAQDIAIENLERIDFSETENLVSIENTWDIFSKNAEALEADFKLLTAGRKSQPIPDSNYVKNPEKIFIEEGAEVENCSLNASSGSIYIGKNAKLLEGCLIRGGFAACEGALVKMGAKIYGATTLGPGCRGGGEINNAVMFANSNKGHDGYLGNSVLGEWCNLGADTNNSNLKNNYAEVRLWDYDTEGFAKTGLQFCGLMMGDHSKCAINTMFNTGTIVGVSANVFGAGFPRNFVPSFSWGGSAGLSTYQTRKAFEVAEIVMQRRNLKFTEVDKRILEHVFEETAKWRRWE